MAVSKEIFTNAASCVIATNGYNGGSSTGDAPASNTAQTWTMGTGNTSFPSASNSSVPATYFYIRDPADATNEIIQVTNVSGTTWSVTRGAEGTATATHAAGATFVQVISHATLQNFKQALSAATSAVAVGNTTNEIVIANYTPTSDELIAGATWEVIAFGPLGKANGAYTVAFNIYWGGSGSPGSTFTTTGSVLLASIKTGSNTVALNTTMAAGGSFDANGTITLLSTTTATANLNLFWSGITATAAANSATTTNTSASGGTSSATAKTISGAGPIILTAVWTGTANASSTLTATAPVIYRCA